MPGRTGNILIAAVLVAALSGICNSQESRQRSGQGQNPQKTRRTQRVVPMKEVQVSRAVAPASDRKRVVAPCFRRGVTQGENGENAKNNFLLISNLGEEGEDLAGRQGFEPRSDGPEPPVLPLDDLPALTEAYSRKSSR